MKTNTLYIILFLISFKIQAQSYYDTTACFYSVCSAPYVDTIYSLCDSVSTPSFKLRIDNTTNNVWQFTHTPKFNNPTFRDSSCTLVTDSLNSYPTNNYSTFTVFLNPNTWVYNQYFKFWHRFDTDSLLDGCWIECSDDSGANWYPLNTPGIGTLSLDNNFNACNLYTNQLTQSDFDTLADGRFAWSGNSQGWRYTAMELNMVIPLKTWRNGMINALRFVFQSDSIQTNKAGWMIDDIETGYVVNCGGLTSTSRVNALPIYPNPSSNGVFQISFPEHFVKTSIQIYNLQGQQVMDTPLTKTLDLSKCAAGLYYYRTFIDKQSYSGTLSIMH